MILTLQDFWQWSDYIKPIALVDPTDEELPSNTECQSSGYGMSQHINGNPVTAQLPVKHMDARTRPMFVWSVPAHVLNAAHWTAQKRNNRCNFAMDGYQLHNKS